MDFITVREFRTEPGKVWEKLEAEKELVITKNGKPFAVLTSTRPNMLEEDLKALRRARAAAAVETMRKRAQELGLNELTLEEINAEIAAARKEIRENSRGRASQRTGTAAKRQRKNVPRR